jgi:hypothetical protein
MVWVGMSVLAAIEFGFGSNSIRILIVKI